MYTTCIKNIYEVVMRPVYAESFDVTEAGRSVDPADVPRWYKGGAYCTPLRFSSGDAARLVMIIDIKNRFAHGHEVVCAPKTSIPEYHVKEQQQLKC
jgi:hypothetical protein